MVLPSPIYAHVLRRKKFLYNILNKIKYLLSFKIQLYINNNRYYNGMGKYW